MLGKLTRWLRMLGHDIHYYRHTDDKILIEMAKTEKRFLLTSDLELYETAVTQGAKAFFVTMADETERIASLAKHFGFDLKIDLSVSRCPKCNELIKTVSKKMVINKIPKMTSKNYNDFWKCQGCGKIYWQGAHWKNIRKTLKEADNKLKQI
jgi:uncharacterized protein with PIN domain